MWRFDWIVGFFADGNGGAEGGGGLPRVATRWEGTVRVAFVVKKETPAVFMT